MARNIWQEYDALAEDCAKRGIAGRVGDALPLNIAADVMGLVNDDPEAFADRVRLFGYALAMEKHAS